MKSFILLLMLLIAASLHAQVDFTECEKVTAPWKAEIDEYNAAHKAKGDGFQIQAGCMWSNPEPVKPKIKYPISASEALVLHRLREASYRAFRAMNAYQDYLLAAHGHPKMEYSNPCYHFIGFVLDEDFITEDPNVSFTLGCNLKGTQ